MNRQIIAYANALSIVVLAQSLKIAQLQQQIDASNEVLLKLTDLIHDILGEIGA